MDKGEIPNPESQITKSQLQSRWAAIGSWDLAFGICDLGF
jgi:hypothetical protein